MAPARRGSARRGAVLCVAAVLAVGCAGDGDPGEDDLGGAPGGASADEPAAPTGVPTGAVPTADGAGERAEVVVSTLDGDGCPDATAGADFPDVVGATLTPVPDDPTGWRVSVTLCSLYDTPERYADAWRVRTPDGDVLAVRELLHDHAAEQPFTRSLGAPVTVPDGTGSLVLEGRDLVNGWGGTALDVELDG